MKIWKVILATLVIFAAGMFAGGVVSRKTQPAPSAPKSPPPPIITQQHFYERLKKELDLSAEQTNRMDKVFAEGNARVKIIWDLLGPELAKERQETYDGIRAALTPEQREKFERLVKERPPGRKGDFDGQRSGRSKQGTNSGGTKGPRSEAPPKSAPPVR